MPLFKKAVRKRSETKQRSMKEILSELSFLDKQVIGGNREAINQFFKAVRSFFAEYFQLHYKFTYEELEQEFESHRLQAGLRQEFSIFIRELSVLEYGGPDVSPEDTHGLIQRFEGLVHQLGGEKPKEQQAARGPSRLYRLMAALAAGLLLAISGVSSLLDIFRRRHASASKLQNMLGEGAAAVKKGDLAAGRKIYLEASATFDCLNSNEKRQYYSQLISLYNDVIALHRLPDLSLK